MYAGYVLSFAGCGIIVMPLGTVLFSQFKLLVSGITNMVTIECLTMQNHAMLHSFVKLGVQYLFRSFLSLLVGWFSLNTALCLYLHLNVIGSSVQRTASPYSSSWRLRVIFWQNTRKKCSGTGNKTSLSSTIAPSSLYRKTPLYLRVPKTREWPVKS